MPSTSQETDGWSILFSSKLAYICLIMNDIVVLHIWLSKGRCIRYNKLVFITFFRFSPTNHDWRPQLQHRKKSLFVTTTRIRCACVHSLRLSGSKLGSFSLLPERSQKWSLAATHPCWLALLFLDGTRSNLFWHHWMFVVWQAGLLLEKCSFRWFLVFRWLNCRVYLPLAASTFSSKSDVQSTINHFYSCWSLLHAC